MWVAPNAPRVWVAPNAPEADVSANTPKIEAARRRILEVRSSARIEAFTDRRAKSLTFGAVATGNQGDRYRRG